MQAEIPHFRDTQDASEFLESGAVNQIQRLLKLRAQGSGGWVKLDLGIGSRIAQASGRGFIVY